MENLKNKTWNRGKTGWEKVEAMVDGEKVKAKMGERAVMSATMADAEDVEEPEREAWPLEKMFNEGKFDGEKTGEGSEKTGGDSERTGDDFSGEQGKAEEAGNENENSSEDDTEKFRPVGELTKEEATKEYLDILDDLSRGFTSPEAIASGAAVRRDGEVVSLGRGYDGKDDRIVGQLEGEEGEHAEREYAIGMADDIIRAEADWRKVQEDADLEDERAKRDQAELHLEIARKAADDRLERFEQGTLGKVRKVLRPRKHVELKNDVINLRNQAPEKTAHARKTEGANRRLQEALETAYSEDYEYGRHDLSYEHRHEKGYRERKNQEYNEKFFSPENQPKIDRAVELRGALEKFEPKITSNWKDKYWMQKNLQRSI